MTFHFFRCDCFAGIAPATSSPAPPSATASCRETASRSLAALGSEGSAKGPPALVESERPSLAPPRPSLAAMSPPRMLAGRATAAATRAEVYEGYWKQWCAERCDHPPEVPEDQQHEEFSTSRGQKQTGPPPHLLLGDVFLSPYGLGTHYFDDSVASKEMIVLALEKGGINVIDTAPNYSNVEAAIGDALAEVTTERRQGSRSRESIVLVSKVGNVVGEASIAKCRSLLQPPRGNGNDNELPFFLPHKGEKGKSTCHCLHPDWIEAELAGTLQRLRVETLDVLLLHNPETWLYLRGFYSGSSETEPEILDRQFYGGILKAAFAKCEQLVQRGKIACYGVSGAFYPLRPSEPQHLVLGKVMQVAGPGFRVIQFPLNFAEPQPLTQPQVARHPDGIAVGIEKPTEEEEGKGADEMNASRHQGTLVELARKKYGLFLLLNRPLNGIYKEAAGVCRFASEVPINSSLQPEDVDMLEMKLGKYVQRGPGQSENSETGGEDPEDHITGQLAGKTLLTLGSLQVGTVLCGLRTPSYLVSAWAVLVANLQEFRMRGAGGGGGGGGGGKKKSEIALEAVREVHRSVDMWLCMAGAVEEDRGTSKNWRLPPKPKL